MSEMPTLRFCFAHGPHMDLSLVSLKDQSIP
jgi:hypothetical protein